MRIFDAHLHIIDPQYGLVPNEDYVPDPFTADEYRAVTEPLGIVGGAVVSGSFHGFGQEHLLDALRVLGPAFVGVAQLPSSVTDAEINKLHASGVRAVRLNLRRGMPCSLDDLSDMAARAFDLAGWHAEVYADGAQLADVAGYLSGLPKVVIDHLGLTREGGPTLLNLVESGAFVKATGFGRLDFDFVPVIRDLTRANPGALLFGTDLPSTRAPRPFRQDDLQRLVDALDPGHVERVLFHNAVSLYRPDGLHP